MPDKLSKYILDNGLTVYFYNDESKHSIHAELVTRFGGMTKDFIYKDKEYHICDGIAHLLEHFVCEYGQSGNYLKLVGEKLIDSNAVTSRHCTRYFIDGVENMEYALLTMLDNVYNPVFTDNNFEKVKKPIFEEIRRFNDRKFCEFSQKQCTSIFHKNKFKSVLGTIKEIEELSLETVKLCYDAFYNPNNQFLIVAGNFDKEKYLDIINNFFKDNKTKITDVEVIQYDEPATVKNKEFCVYKETSDTFTSITYKINVSGYSPREKLDLEKILYAYLSTNFGYYSDVKQNLVDNKIIVGGVNYYVLLYKDVMTFSIEAYNTDSSAFINTVDKVINEKNLNKELFELNTKGEFTGFITSFDNLASTIIPFIENITIFDYPYLDEAKDFDIPYDKYKETIEKLDFSNYTIGHLINPKNK